MKGRGHFEDLTGLRFGRLTVYERADDYVSPEGQHEVRWLCICDCGTETIVKTRYLKKGAIKSCGCLRHECRSWLPPKGKKEQKYDVYEDYAVGYVNDNTLFYIDLDDLERVSSFNWYKDKEGYLYTYINTKQVRLTQFIMNCADVVYYKNGSNSKNDNRKSNLTLTRPIAVKIPSNNTSGVVGVSYDKKRQLWVAYIRHDGKRKTLGRFIDKQDAIQARKNAELSLGGENNE